MTNSNHNWRMRSGKAFNYQALEPRNLLASFVGTESADVVTVTFVGGVPQTIEINGNVNNNPDPTADLDLMGGDDQITLLGSGIDLTLTAADNEPDGQGTGSANGNFDFVFDGNISVTTSQSADTVDISGSGLVGFRFDLDTGGGDDIVTYRGGLGSIDLGDGDDHAKFTTNTFDAMRSLAGGEGDDTWEFVDVAGRLEFRGVDDNGQAVFGFPCCFDGDPFGLSGYYSGFESVIAPDPTTLDQSSIVFAHSDRSGNSIPGINFQINGRIATSVDTRLTAPLAIENFNSFRSGRDSSGDPFVVSKLSIFSTAYDLETRYYNRVEVGFSVDPKTGITANINHALDVSANTLVVSDYLGNGRDIQVDRESEFKYQIGGLTDVPVLFSSENNSLTLWGSNLESNHFAVDESNVRLTMYGGNGDDTFDIGGTKQDLDLITRRTINVVGGEGVDRINVFDGNSEGRNSYRMRERWVFHSPDPRGVASREFSGLWHIQAERVDVNGNDSANIFRITPSVNVDYKAIGAGLDSGDGDKILLVGNVPEHQLIHSASTYFFGNESGDAKPIRYAEIEQVTERGIIAAATTAGISPALVEVYDAWNQSKLNTIQPYNSGYLGGINVATGYVLPGSTPAVITAPANNGFGSIRVFDAETGERIHEFRAFGVSHGGFDVATGNVLGDGRYEIIVSQMTSNSTNFQNEIEIWEQVDMDGETTWQVNRTISPFANAPEIGTRLSVNGDFNFDGYDDIVAGAGPGWLPQVAIYDVNGETAQLHRFLVHDKSFRGGVFVEAANLIGNRKSDVLASFAPTGNQSESNMVRVFRGERLFRNSGGTVLSPDHQTTLIPGDQATSIAAFDTDFDLRHDHFYTASSGVNDGGLIQVFNKVLNEIDRFFAGEDFLNGAELG